MPDHEHVHTHEHHEHEHHSHVTPEALLAHMAEHNSSHLTELEEIAGQLQGDAAEKTRAAAECYRRGNELLAQALAAVKEDA